MARSASPDTTSLYFEGEGGKSLGRPGLLEDYHPHLKQVVLGVVSMAMTGHRLFLLPGNTADVTTLVPLSAFAKIADTLSDPRAVGRLSRVCDRWIYACVCFALDFDEQKRSGFRDQYSNYQIEYSRNLIFAVGGHMDQVFQALIDRSRLI